MLEIFLEIDTANKAVTKKGKHDTLRYSDREGRKNQMTTSIEVAKRFLELAEGDNNTLTPMQLIKLTYIAHGWMLGLYSKPLFDDEIQAWQYGPVMPKLYRVVKEYRSSPVRKIDSHIGRKSLDSAQEDIIEQVYQKYGHLTGIQLSSLTHAPGTPWDITWSQDDSCISNDLIEDHYRRMSEKNGGTSQKNHGCRA